MRDRNDLPVAGATVTFAIAGGRTVVFANGGSTLTVTTNATGRAVATGLRASISGAVQIDVQAAFQGQIAVATIQQTNVTQSAATSSSGSAAVGKTGGGFPRGAIFGIAGGAAAGVGVAVTRGKGERTFTAALSAPYTRNTVACTIVETWTGSLVLRLDVAANGSVTGNAMASFSTLLVSVSAPCSGSFPPGSGGPAGTPLMQVTGTTSRIVSSSKTTTQTPMAGPRIDEWTFSGNLTSDVVTGTLELLETYTEGTGSLARATFDVTGRSTLPN